MTREEVEQVLIAVLVEIQIQSGHPPPQIDILTCPVGGLPGFDSMTALEAAVEVEDRLGCHIGEVNPFVNQQEHRALCVDEIVNVLLRLLETRMVTNEG